MSANQLAERFVQGLQVQTIEPPPVYVPPDPSGDVVDLASYRTAMESARLESLDNPGVYLDTSPTGAGKSFADGVALRKAASGLVVLPTHGNCEEVEEELQGREIDAAAYPRRLTTGGTEDPPNCWNTDADAAEAIGLSAISSVCHVCPHRGKCNSSGYLLKLQEASDAAVSIATHQRAVFTGLAKLGKGRSYQAIHEDAVSILRPTAELTRNDLLQCQDVLDRLLSDPKCLDWFGSDRRRDKDGRWISDAKQGERRGRIYAFVRHLADVADWLAERLRRAKRTEQLTPPHSMPKPTGTDQRLFKTSREVGASYSGQPWRVLLAAGTGDLLSLGVVCDEAFKTNKSDTAKTDSCGLEQPAEAHRDRVV